MPGSTVSFSEALRLCAEEILQQAVARHENLVGLWDFRYWSATRTAEEITDLSGNGNDLVFPWDGSTPTLGDAMPDAEKLELTKEELMTIAQAMPAGHPLQKKAEDAYRSLVLREQAARLGRTWERGSSAPRSVYIRDVVVRSFGGGDRLEDYNVSFPTEETASLFFCSKEMAQMLDRILAEDEEHDKDSDYGTSMTYGTYREAKELLKLAGWQRMG